MLRGTDGGIAWEERGARDAEPLLLIRPLGGAMALWAGFADELAKEHRVIAFDPRGVGRSGGSARTSTRALAADARVVLDARGVENAHVFGISLGGMIAQRLTLDAPGRVRRLVLASTAACGAAFEVAGLRRAFGFGRCFCRSRADTERCLVLRVLSERFRREYPQQAHHIAEIAAREPGKRRTLLAHALAAARHDARAELASIRVPTLVLAGDRDPLLGPRAGEDLANAIPNAKRTVIADAGHDLTLEQPLETARAVLAFFDQRMSTVQMA